MTRVDEIRAAARYVAAKRAARERRTDRIALAVLLAVLAAGAAVLVA